MDNCHIKSLDDLRVFARDMAQGLSGGDIIAMSGPLGAGKTTIVQMVAKELGVKDSVLSPTFSILKIYNTEGGKIKKLCHIDLYRVEKYEESIGIEECFEDKECVCFIEWAEKISDRIPKTATWIKIAVNKDGSRDIIKK